MRFFWYIVFVVSFFVVEPCSAQKLVDPNAVAPDFREAAEKRRAEQIKLNECYHKADQAKVLPRDRAAHINSCLEAAAGK
jgi:hypothetical protein